MSQNAIQPSFASGELSPSLFARVDLTKYHTGAATMRNFFVDYRSGTSSRPGFQFINQSLGTGPGSLTPTRDKRTRLIPFQFSSTISYALEFGEGYIRFFTNGGAVLEPTFAVSAATQANPCVLTIVGNNYAAGDWIFVTGILGMTQLNGRYFIVTNVAGNLVTIANPLTQIPINSFGYNTYVSGGTAARVYTIASPYLSADLPLLKYVQQQSIMTLTHVGYQAQILTAIAATNWTIAAVAFGTSIAAPGPLTVSPSGGGALQVAYAVTAVDANGQESTATAGSSTGINIMTSAGSFTIQWPSVVGATGYNVYKAEPALGALGANAPFGFMMQGIPGVLYVVDSNIQPDFTQTPPIVNNPFVNNNPGCSCYFQQRQYFAGSNSFPTTFYGSIPGTYTNFNTNDPILDDSAITGTLVSIQLNAIKHMLPMPGGLILLTYGGAWQLSSGSGIAATGAVTPANATANPQAYNGASDVPPIVIDYDILYVQSKGSIVRDLSYNIYANIYTGADISVLSNHLFYNHQIQEWAWQEEPFKIVWAVRDDGILLSLTYIKSQELYGWARHDTMGLIQSVCSIREGNVDAVYVIVKRLIAGAWVQFVERLDNRTFIYGAEDAFCVDAGLRTVGAGNATITVSANISSGAATITASAPTFAAPNVGSFLRFDGGIFSITGFSSTTVVTGIWTQAASIVVPGTTLPVPTTNWAVWTPATSFQGLDHLEGQTVSILADGAVMPSAVVTGGTVTIPQPASKVVIGLPFQAQLQTMYLDIGQETDSIQGKRKKINALTVRARETRGLKFGRVFSDIFPLKEMNPSVMLGQPIPLITADERCVMPALWDTPGQIVLQLDDPLPATVLGVVPEISIGDTGKP